MLLADALRVLSASGSLIPRSYCFGTPEEPKLVRRRPEDGPRRDEVGDGAVSAPKSKLHQSSNTLRVSSTIANLRYSLRDMSTLAQG